MLHEGWINLDEKPIHGAYYFNALNKIKLNDSSVIHIHAEHFLEHLDYFHSKEFLSECYRILQNKGTIRIIVPDAEKYITAYYKKDLDFFKSLEDLGGTPKPLETPMHIINQMFRMGGDHKFAWDFNTLEHVLKEIGFKNINKSFKNNIAEKYDIDGDDWWREAESLYVNAEK